MKDETKALWRGIKRGITMILSALDVYFGTKDDK
jgi:hypothetical protein